MPEEWRTELDRVRQEFRELERTMNARVETISRENGERHQENRLRLQNIDHQAQLNGKATTDLTQIVTSVETRMNLLFGEDGKGFFEELRKEVKAVNQKIMYAAGFLAGAYFIITWLFSHHIL